MVCDLFCTEKGECADTFVKFENRASLRALFYFDSVDKDSKSEEACKAKCQNNGECYGFTWMDDRNNFRCYIHLAPTGDTSPIPHYHLYIRDTCVPGMFTVQQVTVILFRFFYRSRLCH